MKSIKQIGRLLRVCILLILTFSLSAQNFDSLKNNILLAEQVGNDSTTMEKMLELANKYRFASRDSATVALKLVDQCLAFANKNNLDTAVLRTKKIQAFHLRSIGEFQKAINLYDELIASYTSQKSKKTKAQLLDNKSSVLVSSGKRDEALQCKLDALEIFKEHGDSLSLAICYGGIARLYISSSEAKQAIPYCHKAISYRDLKDPKSRVGFEYHYLAVSHKNLNQPDSALYYYKKCQQTSKHISYLYNDNEAKLGEFYVTQGNYQEAQKIFENLISNYDKDINSPALNYYRVLYSSALFNVGDLDRANQTFAMIDTNKLRKRHFTWWRYGKAGYEIENEEENYKKALEYYKIYRDHRDSIFQVKRTTRLKEIESKYNVAEKEKIITKQEIKLKNRLLIIGGLLSILLLGGLLYSNRVRKLRFQKQLSEQDRELKAKEILNLKQENKIISMQSMLEGQEEERKRIARDLHDNIGSLMTTIKMKILTIQKEVESIEKINITQELDSMVTNASQEVRRISHSMTPVAMDISGLLGAVEDLDYQLSSNGIDYQVDADDLDQITDKHLSINLFRIIQESINNTIKHADATQVSVSAKVEDKNILIEIGDNGVGFDSVLWEKSETIGLSGIKSRIEYLGGTVTLLSSNGTHFQINIPLS